MQTPLRAVVLVFGALLLATVAQGTRETEAGMWSELLTIDCAGHTHILANTPFAVSFDDGSSEFQHFWFNAVLQRAHARCPTASKADFQANLIPSLHMLLNLLWGSNTALPCDTDWAQAFDPMLNPNSIKVDMDFPASCSPQTLADGKGCLLQLDLSGVTDSSLHIAADSCPGSDHNMFLSVTLGGALATFMQPCGSTAGCRGGLSCSALPGMEQMTGPELKRAIQSGLEMAGFFDSAVDDPRCLGAQGQVDFVGEFKTFLTTHFFNGWGSITGDTMEFCGADMLSSAMSAAMSEPPTRRAATALAFLTQDAVRRLSSLRDRVVHALSQSSSQRRAMAAAARVGESAARVLASAKDSVLDFFAGSAFFGDAAARDGARAERTLLQTHDDTHGSHAPPPSRGSQPPSASHDSTSHEGPAYTYSYGDDSYGGEAGFYGYETTYGSVAAALAGEAVTVALDAIPGLVPWDGVLPSGAAVLGADRKSGAVFGVSLERPPFAGAGKPVFGVNGEAASMYMQLSARVGMSVALPHVNKALDFGARLLKRVQDCRGDGSPLSSEQFRARFVPWSPEYMMAAMTKLAGPVTWGKHMRDALWGDVRPPFSPVGRLRPPPSCLYAAWVGGEGVCAMEFTGLAALLGVEELGLGWVMRKQAFAGSARLGQLPSMELQCRGPLCAVVSELTLCDADADCGPDTVCADMVYGREGEALAADMVGEMLWQGACSDPWSMHRTQCSVPSFRQEFRQFVASLRNDGGAGLKESRCLSELSTRIGVCSVDAASMDSEYMEREVTRHMDGSMSLRHLGAWAAADLSVAAAPPDASEPEPHEYQLGRDGHGQAPPQPEDEWAAPLSGHAAQPRAPPASDDRAPAPPLSLFFSGFSVGALLTALTAFVLELRRRRLAQAVSSDLDANGTAALMKQDSVAIAARAATKV